MKRSDCAKHEGGLQVIWPTVAAMALASCAGWLWLTFAEPADFAAAQTQGAQDGQPTLNPHGDLIFRATGTTSCTDCHRVDHAKGGRFMVLDNAAVQGLIAKGKGAHSGGRYADCFRCHAGGRKGVEKY